MEYNAQAEMDERVKLSDDEIQVVKDALKTKLFVRDEPDEVRIGKFQTMVTALCEKLQIPEVRLDLATDDEVKNRPGYVCFNGEENRLYINKRFSLVTTLHGVGRAFLVLKGPEYQATLGDCGLFLESFGFSVFKQAAPKMYASAKESGKLIGFEAAPYTDGGRLPVDNAFNRPAGTDGDGDGDGDCDGNCGDSCNGGADVDPENRGSDDPEEGAGGTPPAGTPPTVS